MENVVLDSLEDLGYSGPLLNDDDFDKEIADGAKSVKFTEVVAWLSNELNTVCKMEDNVNSITDPDDWNTFQLELSAFLKEMNCPVQALTEGAMSQRLLSKENKLLLLGFLCSELEAARMIKVTVPDSSALQVQVRESTTAKDLKILLVTLGFGKPPPNITPAQLFSKAEAKLRELVPKVGAEVMSSKPLFAGGLSEKQWFALGKLHEQMQDEYRLRRETLIKRLDLTIQSFKWSERLKGLEDKIMQAYQPRRCLMVAEPSVTIGDVLAAREDLAVIDKTSSAAVRKHTQSKVNKVLIGSVPDRGGRPEEQQPPPPEMPSWQKRTDTPQRGGGYGGGNPYSSGRVQGAGWDGRAERGRGGGGSGYGGGGYGGHGDAGGYGGRQRDGYGGGYGQQGGYGGGGSGGGYRGGSYGQQEGRGKREGYGGGRDRAGGGSRR